MARAEYSLPIGDHTIVNGVTTESRSLLREAKGDLKFGIVGLAIGGAGITTIAITETTTNPSIGFVLAFLASCGVAFLGGSAITKGIGELSESKKQPPYNTGLSINYGTDFHPKHKARLLRQGVLKRFRHQPMNSGIYTTGYSRRELKNMTRRSVNLSQPKITFTHLQGDPERAQQIIEDHTAPYTTDFPPNQLANMTTELSPGITITPFYGDLEEHIQEFKEKEFDEAA